MIPTLLPIETRIGYPSLCYFRQQAPHQIAGFFPFVQRSTGDPWTNRVRLPELDEKAVEIQPPVKSRLSNNLPDIGTNTGEGRVKRHTNGNPSEMSVFGRDSSECQGNPSYFRQRDQENYISELCRLREVDRSRTRVTYKQG